MYYIYMLYIYYKNAYVIRIKEDRSAQFQRRTHLTFFNKLVMKWLPQDQHTQDGGVPRTSIHRGGPEPGLKFTVLVDFYINFVCK